MIDEQTHKQMLSYYYKKQEEQKKLEEDNEDAYMNSSWADTKQLKSSLHGQSNVKWKF
jgi:cilia- and flagella-associated protein 298